MYETFLNTYREANPADTITELDLFKENLSYYGNEAISGMYKSSVDFELTINEENIVKTITYYLEQFLAVIEAL